MSSRHPLCGLLVPERGVSVSPGPSWSGEGGELGRLCCFKCTATTSLSVEGAVQVTRVHQRCQRAWRGWEGLSLMTAFQGPPGGEGQALAPSSVERDSNSVRFQQALISGVIMIT